MRNLQVLIILSFFFTLLGCQDESDTTINNETVRNAERIFGLNFTNAERDSLLGDLENELESYKKIREQNLANSVPPALQFNPLPLNFRPPVGKSKFILGSANRVTLPENMQDLAFYSVRDLAVLIRTKKITSLKLTQFFLDRLKKYDSKLHCVITLTEDLALQEAEKGR